MEDTPVICADEMAFLFPFLGSLLFVVIHIVINFLLVRHISSRSCVRRLYSAIFVDQSWLA